jgi:hypothetical protein
MQLQGMRELRLWCQRAMVMVSESNGYGVREQWLWCQRVTVMVSESKDYGVSEEECLACCRSLDGFCDELSGMAVCEKDIDEFVCVCECVCECLLRTSGENCAGPVMKESQAQQLQRGRVSGCGRM